MAPAPFPDGEAVLMALLEQVAPTVQTTPPDAQGPLIRVLQVGGTSNRVDTRPVLEVACIGETYADARRMAAECEQIILDAKGKSVHGVDGYPKGVLIDRASVSQVPRDIPYRDSEMRRKTANYQLVMRRPVG